MREGHAQQGKAGEALTGVEPGCSRFIAITELEMLSFNKAGVPLTGIEGLFRQGTVELLVCVCHNDNKAEVSLTGIEGLCHDHGEGTVVLISPHWGNVPSLLNQTPASSQHHTLG